MQVPTIHLVFIRHGLTDWNIEGRFQGRLDVPLNERGLLQAEVLRERFANTRFDRVYSSPLKRALKTARIIVGADIPVTIDWRLAEVNHGSWQGKTKEEVTGQPHSVEDGESDKQVRARTTEFLAAVRHDLSLQEVGSALCVSHGVIIQTVCSILLETPQLMPQNASIHHFTLRKNQVLNYFIE